MNRNIGAADRAVRIVAGVALLAMVFVGPRTPLGWLGLIPLLTAAVNFCPLYAVLGISTCRTGTR
jgi:hypothetical protein